MAAATTRSPAAALVDLYRPRTLDQLLGQPWVSLQLQLFVENPYPAAFLFEGASGTGKTSAALLLAEALGVAVIEAEVGGLHQIASGEQTGESVRRVMGGLRCRPFCGSGWKVLIVNEADAMTANAGLIWLDALENLPPQAVVIFTTNAPGKLPGRLRDRCERFAFESAALFLRPALQELAARVWAEQHGKGPCPPVEAFGNPADSDGNASFRRLLQNMTPFLRSGRRPVDAAVGPLAGPAPAAAPSPQVDRGVAARKAWATRRLRSKEAS